MIRPARMGIGQSKRDGAVVVTRLASDRWRVVALGVASEFDQAWMVEDFLLAVGEQPEEEPPAATFAETDPYQTRGVLAGGYRGKGASLASTLTHCVECDATGFEVRVLCGKVKLDNIGDYYGQDTTLPPTCPTCLARDPRRGAKFAAIDPRDKAHWDDLARSEVGMPGMARPYVPPPARPPEPVAAAWQPGDPPITDWSRVQRIRNGIAEGELILRAGRKPAPELAAIRAGVNRALASIGEVPTRYAQLDPEAKAQAVQDRKAKLAAVAKALKEKYRERATHTGKSRGGVGVDFPRKFSTTDPSLRAAIEDFLLHEPPGRRVGVDEIQRAILRRGNFSKIPVVAALRDLEREGAISQLDQFGFVMRGALAGSSASHADGCPSCGKTRDQIKSGETYDTVSGIGWNKVRAGDHALNVRSSTLGTLSTLKDAAWDEHLRTCGGNAYDRDCAAQAAASAKANMNRWGVPFHQGGPMLTFAEKIERLKARRRGVPFVAGAVSRFEWGWLAGDVASVSMGTAARVIVELIRRLPSGQWIVYARNDRSGETMTVDESELRKVDAYAEGATAKNFDAGLAERLASLARIPVHLADAALYGVVGLSDAMGDALAKLIEGKRGSTAAQQIVDALTAAYDNALRVAGGKEPTRAAFLANVTGGNVTGLVSALLRGIGVGYAEDAYAELEATVPEPAREWVVNARRARSASEAREHLRESARRDPTGAVAAFAEQLATLKNFDPVAWPPTRSEALEVLRSALAEPGLAAGQRRTVEAALAAAEAGPLPPDVERKLLALGLKIRHKPTGIDLAALTDYLAGGAFAFAETRRFARRWDLASQRWVDMFPGDGGVPTRDDWAALGRDYEDAAAPVIERLAGAAVRGASGAAGLAAGAASAVAKGLAALVARGAGVVAEIGAAPFKHLIDVVRVAARQAGDDAATVRTLLADGQVVAALARFVPDVARYAELERPAAKFAARRKKVPTVEEVAAVVEPMVRAEPVVASYWPQVLDFLRRGFNTAVVAAPSIAVLAPAMAALTGMPIAAAGFAAGLLVKGLAITSGVDDDMLFREVDLERQRFADVAAVVAQAKAEHGSQPWWGSVEDVLFRAAGRVGSAGLGGAAAMGLVAALTAAGAPVATAAILAGMLVAGAYGNMSIGKSPMIDRLNKLEEGAKADRFFILPVPGLALGMLYYAPFWALWSVQDYVAEKAWSALSAGAKAVVARLSSALAGGADPAVVAAEAEAVPEIRTILRDARGRFTRASAAEAVRRFAEVARYDEQLEAAVKARLEQDLDASSAASVWSIVKGRVAFLVRQVTGMTAVTAAAVLPTILGGVGMPLALALPLAALLVAPANLIYGKRSDPDALAERPTKRRRFKASALRRKIAA